MEKKKRSRKFLGCSTIGSHVNEEEPGQSREKEQSVKEEDQERVLSWKPGEKAFDRGSGQLCQPLLMSSTGCGRILVAVVTWRAPVTLTAAVSLE